MNNEMNFEANECLEEAMEVCELPAKSTGNKIVKASLITLGVAAVGGAIVTIVRKRKNKRKKSVDDLLVKRLEKKGYTIVPPIDIDCDIEEDVVEESIND